MAGAALCAGSDLRAFSWAVSLLDMLACKCRVSKGDVPSVCEYYEHSRDASSQHGLFLAAACELKGIQAAAVTTFCLWQETM